MDNIMNLTFVLGIVVGTLMLRLGHIAAFPTIADTKAVVDTLFADYRTYILPVQNQHGNVTVQLTLFMKSIQAFDEVAEKFSFSGALVIQWHDESLVWNPGSYNGVSQLVVPYDHVWTPRLILSTAATSTNSIEQDWNTVRILSTGQVWWLPANLFESTCAVNVRNYPFDTQICDTSFFSLGYKVDEVELKAASESVDLSLMQPNALWEVVDSSVKVEVIAGGESEITFSMHLRRKSSYVVVNVVLPILFLSLLNICVFLLVPESGERIGYCITALLAIAVYMTIIADMLPQSSEPVPIISYKLMVDMIISALIVFVTIMTMKMHNTDDDVPVTGWALTFYNVLSCSCFRRSSDNHNKKDNSKVNEIKPVKTTVITGLGGNDKPVKTRPLPMLDCEAESIADDNPTWKDVGKVTDMAAVIVFTSVSLGSFIAFICIANFG